MELIRKLYFVRHGESINNVFEREDRSTYAAKRVPDPDLSQLGVCQSEELRERLARLRIDKVVCSPMIRCLKTVQIAFGHLDVEIEVRDEFYEQGGVWDLNQVYPGIGRIQIETEFPKFNSTRIQDNGYFFLDHMETVDECRARVARALEILRDYKEENLVIVCHGLFMEKVAECVSRMEGKECKLYIDVKIPQENTGITLVEIIDGKMTLKYQFSLNSISS